MNKNMPEFNTQITPPEEPLRPDRLRVNEGDSIDENIGDCRDIVEMNVKNLLLEAITKIEDSIAHMDQVEDSGVVNNIDLLKASLSGLFQKIQFAQYDLQYGLVDGDETVIAPFELSGDAFDTLSFLEGVTCVLDVAKGVVASLKIEIRELQEIIDRTQAEKEGLSDDKKFKRRRATLDKTINTRAPRKKKKEEKRKALVAALNTFLEVDPDNLDEIWENTKKLIGFLQDNGWMNHFTTPEDAQIISSIPESVEVTKIIIPTEKEPREKVQYELIERKKQKAPGITTRNMVLLGALGVLALGAGASPFLKSHLEKIPLSNSSWMPREKLPTRGHTRPKYPNNPHNNALLDKKLAMLDVKELAEKMNKLMQFTTSNGDYLHEKKIHKLQEKIQALNKKHNLGLSLTNQVNFPRVNLEAHLDNIAYTSSLEAFKDMLLDSANMVFIEAMKYRADKVLEDHYVGKKNTLFSKQYPDHVEGPVIMTGRIKAAEETVVGVKIPNATYYGHPGKLVGISTKAEIEITLTGAIDEVITKTITIKGVRFVPEAPYPKTYEVTTPTGPAFLTMAQLKRLHLKPGDYFHRMPPDRGLYGRPEAQSAPTRKQQDFDSLLKVQKEGGKTVITIGRRGGGPILRIVPRK